MAKITTATDIRNAALAIDLAGCIQQASEHGFPFHRGGRGTSRS